MKIKRTKTESNQANQTGNATNLAIWSTAEQGTGIIAATLVTLKPLVRSFLDKGRSRNGSNTAGSTPRASGGRFWARFQWRRLTTVPLSASDAAVSTKTGGVTTTTYSEAAMPSAVRSTARYSYGDDDMFDVLPARNADADEAELQWRQQGEGDLEMQTRGAKGVKTLQAVHLEKN